MKLRTLTICMITTFLWSTSAASEAVIYVDADSPGGDGSSWATAFQYLQDGLAAADANDEIRVAQGTYVPDQNSVNPDGNGDRTATFQLIDNVAIKGGYAGFGAADPDARNATLYKTVLSGDLNGDDYGFINNEENSCSIVNSRDTNSTAVLDGFTITGGNANTDMHNVGAGIDNRDGSPTLLNCTIRNNWARNWGGGMFNVYGRPVLFNCIFDGNYSGYAGGAIYNHHFAPRLTNCTFTRNFAGTRGGAVDNAVLYGGDLMITNCTIAGNEAGERGGGVFLHDGGRVVLTNCILHGNAAYEGPQVALRGAIAVFNYCCVQGGQADLFLLYSSTVEWGPGNTDGDPCFVDAVNDDYHLKSRAGRWEANEERWTIDEVTSPCIDAGHPNSDWTAEFWPHGKRVNMGAFGGTPEASISESLLGNRADLDNNDLVDFGDFAAFSEAFSGEAPLQAEDLNRDAIVNFLDLLEFAKEWLWQGV